MADQRVTLTLSENLVNYLKQEAERTGDSMAEIVRNSLTRTKTIREELGDTNKLVVKDDNGGLKTFVFPK